MNHPWPKPFVSFPFFTNLLFLGQNSFWIWSLPLFSFFSVRLHPHVKIQFSLYAFLWLSWSDWFPDQARDPIKMEGNFFSSSTSLFPPLPQEDWGNFVLFWITVQQCCLTVGLLHTDCCLYLGAVGGGADKTLGFWGCFPAERLNLLPPLSPRDSLQRGTRY